MKNALKIIIVLFFLMAIQTQAQESQQYNAWNALFTSYSLTTSSSLLLEKHYRTKSFYSDQDQILVRPSISRKISKNATLSVGYTYISNGVGPIESPKIIFGNNYLSITQSPKASVALVGFVLNIAG